MKMQLRPPRADELQLLSELCLRSKAVWGYDHAFMRACRAELTIRAEELENSQIRVAEDNGSVVGVVQVIVEGRIADLQKLFIEPSAIGHGAGRVLFDWAKQTAQQLGATVLTIDADPDAVGFYKAMGAVECGSVPSGSISGRSLPHLQIELDRLATNS